MRQAGIFSKATFKRCSEPADFLDFSAPLPKTKVCEEEIPVSSCYSELYLMPRPSRSVSLTLRDFPLESRRWSELLPAGSRGHGGAALLYLGLNRVMLLFFMTPNGYIIYLASP